MLKNYLFSPLCSAPLLSSSPLSLSVPVLLSSFSNASFFNFSFSAAPLFFFLLLVQCSFLFSFLVSCCPSFFFSCSAFYFSAQNRVEPKAQNILLLLVQPLSSLSALAFLFSPHHCFNLFLFCFSLCSFCFTCCPLKVHKHVQLFLCVPPSQFLANF